MTTELITVPFHGDNLFVATIDGQPYAPMKPIVEGMGLDWGGQHKKLAADAERWGISVTEIPSAGGQQNAVCLPMRKLAGWMMTIQPSRVRSELRDKIITYQKECDDALWDYWTKGQATKATYSGTSDHQPQSITPSPIQEILSINDRLSQLPGAEPVAIMDAALTMIEQATGYNVDAMRQVLPHPSSQSQKSTTKVHKTDVTSLEVKSVGVFDPMPIKLSPDLVSCAFEEFEGHKVRIFKTSSDEHWFGGIDVCAAMGYSNPYKALSDHVPNIQKLRIPIETASGKQFMIIASELGVLDLINASQKDGAMRFRDWLYERLPQTDQKPITQFCAIPQNETVSLRELKIDGDMSANDIESWKTFCSQPMHTRLLQLHWISRNRSELAVLWTFCEHHRRTATLGEKYNRKDSGQMIVKKLANRMQCNQITAARFINTLIEEGVLCKKAHVDNVIRRLWLNWSVLAQRLRMNFPDHQVLQLNWLADNKTELCVLQMLAQQWINNSCVVDGVRSAPFVKVTLKTIEHFKNELGVSTNAKAVERAVTKLSESGLIELNDEGVMHKARISHACFIAIEMLLATNFEKELW